MGAHDPLYSTVTPPLGEGYQKWLAYGEKKAKMGWAQMIVQAIMGGFWIALAGHVCTNMGGLFYVVGDPGTAKFIYAALFPLGFVALVFTSAELYTGNAAAMAFYVMHHRTGKSVAALARCWTVSTLFNLGGAVLCAAMLSYATNMFDAHHAARPNAFLMYYAQHKVDITFSEAFFSGIGCNVLVCLASWCAVIVQDGAGKILAIWFTISGFCFGGFEHIVANFYTMSLAIWVMPEEYPTPFSFGNVFVHWIAVWLGNTVAGVTFTGFVWWFCLAGVKHHEEPKVSHDTSNNHQQPHKSFSNVALTKQDGRLQSMHSTHHSDHHSNGHHNAHHNGIPDDYKRTIEVISH